MSNTSTICVYMNVFILVLFFILFKGNLIQVISLNG